MVEVKKTHLNSFKINCWNIWSMWGKKQKVLWTFFWSTTKSFCSFTKSVVQCPRSPLDIKLFMQTVSTTRLWHCRGLQCWDYACSNFFFFQEKGLQTDPAPFETFSENVNQVNLYLYLSPFYLKICFRIYFGNWGVRKLKHCVFIPCSGFGLPFDSDSKLVWPSLLLL